MFPGAGRAETPRHPGQLSLVDWLKGPGTVFHGSFRPDWEGAPMTHVGTQAAASDRLLQVAVNKAPSSPDVKGRIWSRRLTEPAAITTKDSTANKAEIAIKYGDPLAGYDDFADAKQAKAHLEAGRPVGYKNYAEDIDSTSYIAPRGTLRAWHQDVADARNLGLPVHAHDVHLAEHQFDPAISITPKSMRHNIPRYLEARTGSSQQLTMFPWKVEHDGQETLVPVSAEDRDVDDWASPSPGRGSMTRAQALAEETGGKIAGGVYPGYRERELPGGSHLVSAHHSVTQDLPRWRTR
jgi:hypothetical protein